MLTTWTELSLAALFFLLSIYFHVKNENQKSLVCLIAAGMILRFLMITLDPFLHEWDERYHALVAKHMMQHPFMPVLRENPVLPFDYKLWCCNHIWLHKQPLFLWQMALSMSVFGINLIGLRFPDVMMGGLGIYFIYRMALIWTNSVNIAWYSGILYATSYFFLELTSGRFALDHNDLVFSTYAIGSIWAFCEYTRTPSWKFALLVGILAGAAVLVKWLTGLLVFGGWFLFILGSSDRKELKNYLHWAISAGICAAVVIPWQWYILHAFPQEAAWEYAYNSKHMEEALGKNTGMLFHLKFTEAIYGAVFLPFLILGIWQVFRKRVNPVFTHAMLAMVVVVYAFFSLLVATKMGAFTTAVSGILFALTGVGIDRAIAWTGIKTGNRFKSYLPALLFLLVVVSIRPWSIASYRNEDKNPSWADHVNNTRIYQSLQTKAPPDWIVINCKELEDVELMFWQPNNAYQWYPKPEEIQDLLHRGFKIAAFKSHGNQILPEYILKNPEIKILDVELK
jgi:4-amino-4-deoxy-L-arabinose transferase